MTALFLVGAGASFGSGECIPFPPPLGSGLFSELRKMGGVAATITSPLLEIFEKDFETGMAHFRELGRGIELRDEVTRLGLKRGTLSWGSWGLDKGAPTYTLGITPQAHNEGDFTTLGHVVRGMEVVDRIQMGDRIISARRIR